MLCDISREEDGTVTLIPDTSDTPLERSLCLNLISDYRSQLSNLEQLTLALRKTVPLKSDSVPMEIKVQLVEAWLDRDDSPDLLLFKAFEMGFQAGANAQAKQIAAEFDINPFPV